MFTKTVVFTHFENKIDTIIFVKQFTWSLVCKIHRYEYQVGTMMLLRSSRHMCFSELVTLARVEKKERYSPEL